MLTKKFTPRALLQQKKSASLAADLGEVVLQLGYFFLNPTFKSRIGGVSAEQAWLKRGFNYFKNKMSLKEQIIANKLTVAVQEALLRSEIYDLRGMGNKINYSALYGTSFQWVDLPEVKVKFHWINKNIFDTSSKISIKPTSSQLTKLQGHEYYLNELNQSLKDIGGYTLMKPVLEPSGWLEYSLVDGAYSPRLDFTTYEKMAVMLGNPHEFDGILIKNSDAVPLMENLVLSRLDHTLITARTGFGKTFLALSLIAVLGWQDNSILYFLDPKHSDLASFGKFLGAGRYADDTKSINSILHDLVEIMQKRYEAMTKINDSEPGRFVGKTASAYGFDNIVIFFDEISAHLSADKSCLADLKQLMMLGRQAGIFLVLIMQDPRATNNLPSTIKDQTGIRICLGKVSGTVASLIFGAGVELPEDKREVGQGYIQIDGADPQLFDAPLMPTNSYDLYELIKQSLAGQKVLKPLDRT